MEIDTKNIGKISDDIKIIYANNNEPQIVIFKQYYDILCNIKNNIDNNEKLWEKYKKIINPYELLHVSNGKYKKNRIVRYNPISRSYFKMIELIVDYNLLDSVKNKSATFACLAEGPGGFMEAINNYRKSFVNTDLDKIYGITLEPNNYTIPDWSKNINIPKKFNITYGNLYNVNDIKKFSENFNNNNNKAFLVSADGGFDYSVDFNNQEQLSYRIIFCEIITAFSILQINGNFVCKIFDIFNIFTMKIIYLLGCYFEKVYIVKPKTSRVANSEKYIVCKGFKGISPETLNIYFTNISEWKETPAIDIGGIKLNNEFIQNIYEYNKKYLDIQLKYMKDIIYYIENGINDEKYNSIMKDKVEKALEWCKKYNVRINHEYTTLNSF